MPLGRWRDRFIFALKTSLQVLKPHQVALRALTPVLVGDPEEGIFSSSTAFSRRRVQHVFEQAVVGSSDGPKMPIAAALGRLLYLIHLAVLLWWLLDKSPANAQPMRWSHSPNSFSIGGPRASSSARPEVHHFRRRAPS
jgi:hypothetical protein